MSVDRFEYLREVVNKVQQVVLLRTRKARFVEDEIKFSENEITLFHALFGDYIG
jgi:hypothetical protein